MISAGCLNEIYNLHLKSCLKIRNSFIIIYNINLLLMDALLTKIFLITLEQN